MQEPIFLNGIMPRMAQERLQPAREELTDLFTSLIDIPAERLAGRFQNVIAVGLDVCRISLAEQSLAQGFGMFPTVLTPEEIAYCQQYKRKPAQHGAGLFAGKEAIYKALRETPGGAWHEMHIDHDDNGVPVVRLEGKVKERADALGITEMLLSITHDATIAAAICIALGEKLQDR